MFVVDSIKLIFFDEPKEIWKLKGRYPIGLEQHGKAGNKIVDVRHMS